MFLEFLVTNLMNSFHCCKVGVVFLIMSDHSVKLSPKLYYMWVHSWFFKWRIT